MLILAGITISQLTGSGIFENAKLAEQKSKEAQEKEEGILADYENKIGEYVNNNRDTVVNSGLDYSETEVKTNNTWFGKPIYTKTVYISSLPNATTTNYPHNAENVENIWINTGKSYIKSNEQYITVPSVHLTSTGAQVQLLVTSESIRVNTGTNDRRIMQAYITIEYTKTTD